MNVSVAREIAPRTHRDDLPQITQMAQMRCGNKKVHRVREKISHSPKVQRTPLETPMEITAKKMGLLRYTRNDSYYAVCAKNRPM